MCAVIRAKIDRSLWTDLMLRGRRFDGPTARSLRMVHDLALSEAEVLPAALELAKALAPKGENRTTYGDIKTEIYSSELQLLASGLGAANSLVPSERQHTSSNL
eukprot:GHVT01072369.1.p3 GENE.GHVT01072369.1~~GHVT01072369.1.p3  ORF type:complete len:104 (+),score=8.17 GHVT01072369.1:385-696(+)